jgi:hypothetical protein
LPTDQSDYHDGVRGGSWSLNLRRVLHEFRRTPTLPLIVVRGVITAFDAMAIDLHLPGFRDIGRSLGANPATMQTSLSVFVGGAAIGQLLKRTEI